MAILSSQNHQHKKEWDPGSHAHISTDCMASCDCIVVQSASLPAWLAGAVNNNNREFVVGGGGGVDHGVRM